MVLVMPDRFGRATPTPPNKSRLFQAIGSSSSGKQTFSLAVETAETGRQATFNQNGPLAIHAAEYALTLRIRLQ